MDWRESTHVNIQRRKQEKQEQEIEAYIVYDKVTGDEYLRCGNEHIARSTAHRLKMKYKNIGVKKLEDDEC